MKLQHQHYYTLTGVILLMMICIYLELSFIAYRITINNDLNTVSFFKIIVEIRNGTSIFKGVYL